jgi:hypothetical protein
MIPGRGQNVLSAAQRKGEADIPRAESLLASGGRLKVIARQFNLNPYALRRHWLGVSDSRKDYLRFGTRLSQESLQARVADERLASLDHLVLARNLLHKSLMLAFSAGDHGLVANLARAVAENVERSARLSGEWKDHQSPTSVTNNVGSLAMPGVISGIVAALSRHPEARMQVVRYLREADTLLELPAPEVIDATTRE